MARFSAQEELGLGGGQAAVGVVAVELLGGERSGLQSQQLLDAPGEQLGPTRVGDDDGHPLRASDFDPPTYDGALVVASMESSGDGAVGWVCEHGRQPVLESGRGPGLDELLPRGRQDRTEATERDEDVAVLADAHRRIPGPSPCSTSEANSCPKNTRRESSASISAMRASHFSRGGVVAPPLPQPQLRPMNPSTAPRWLTFVPGYRTPLTQQFAPAWRPRPPAGRSCRTSGCRCGTGGIAPATPRSHPWPRCTRRHRPTNRGIRGSRLASRG